MTDGKPKVARAWLSVSGNKWWVECPHCSLYHQHNVDKDEVEDDIVRMPDCPLPWHKKADYRLDVQRQLNADEEDRFERLNFIRRQG